MASPGRQERSEAFVSFSHHATNGATDFSDDEEIDATGYSRRRPASGWLQWLSGQEIEQRPQSGMLTLIPLSGELRVPRLN